MFRTQKEDNKAYKKQKHSKKKMRKETQSWLEQAKEDIKAAEFNVYKFPYVCSLFSQQAAEKALKAHIINEETTIPKVHDLVFLARRAGAENLLDKCEKLSRVYIETRYPNQPGSVPSKKFTVIVSKEHLAIAKEIILWVEKNI